MQKQTFLFMLFFCVLSSTGMAQELSISTAAKTYASGEQIWVNVAVLNAATVPGAYKIKMSYDANKLRYLNILPAKQGPFSITPAASNNGGIVTIAGFQGVVDTGSGNASLVTLVFTPISGSTAIDTASFLIAGKEVYNAQAQVMDLEVTKQATSVLLPSVDNGQRSRIFLTQNYIRFSLVKEGMASVRIFNLSGRICATPLLPHYCKAGHHAVPLGNALQSGVYIVSVRGIGVNVNEKLEVVR